jgi:ABC-type transport system involved in multi-copper enzyme maturation permease subunit
MNKAMAIAARELNGRRSIFLTAAVLAAVPYAVLLMPEIERYGRSSVVAITGSFVAACYVFGLSLLLGATFVGRELMEKRMSFFFGKPVSERAIWFGKLAGGLATLAIATAIIIVPVLAGSGDEMPRLVRALGYFTLAALTLFLVSHAVATMLRSRSMLILADVMAGAIAATAVYLMTHALIAGLAVKLVDALLWCLTIGSLAILVAAGAWQLSRGRIDLRTNHRELSKFLWGATAVMLAIAGAAVLWVVMATPDDIRLREYAEQIPSSDWVVMAGTAKYRGDYQVAFFKNVATGEYQRIPANEMWWGGFFTRDGQHGGRVRRTRELDLLTITPAGVQVTPTPVTVPPLASVVPSDDLKRVAVVTPSMVTVEALDSGRTLAAARLPRGPIRAFFVTPDLLRLYVSGDRQADIYELDVPAKRLTQTGTFSTNGKLWFNASPDGSRLLARSITREGSELLVLDSRTGARIGSLGVQEKGFLGVILSDGRIAALNSRAAKTLSIYGADLALQRQIALPDMPVTRLLREVEGGRMLIVGDTGERGVSAQPIDNTSLRVVDANSGATVRHERRLHPLQSDLYNYDHVDPRLQVTPAGSPLIVLDRGKMKRLTL